MNATHKAKYENAILYFASLATNRLGTTKLAKLLYYLDFVNHRDTGSSVTGATYYKHEYGPLANDLVEVVGGLVGDEKLRIETFNHPKYSRVANDYKALISPDLSVFTDAERILLRKLINKYDKCGTDELVAKSHLEEPWLRAEEGAALDYKYAFDVEDFNESLEKEYEKEDEAMVAALTAASK